MPECRSCGADILWARTASGRAMPVDVEPVAGGNLVLDTEEGGEVIATTVKPDAALPRYQSHFASCPAAGKHRRRG